MTATFTSAPLFREQLGLALRRARKLKKLTLREVSGSAQTSLGYLSEIERGQKEVSSEVLASICLALGIPQSRILQDVASFTLIAENPVPDSPAELGVHLTRSTV